MVTESCSWRAGVVMALVVAVGAAGCSEPWKEPTASGDAAPEACLVLAVTEGPWRGIPVNASFVLSAACSHDDVTARDSLDVRWDYDGSGDWDSEFARELIVDEPPYLLPTGTWSARCEIRDEAGNTSVAARTIELPGWLPTPPDIVAGDVVIRVPGMSTSADTVLVDQHFAVVLLQRGWMDPPMPLVRVDIFVDGDFEASFDARPTAPFAWIYALFDSGTHSIATPGTHQITCVTDAAGDVLETDEDNNRSTRTLVVIEAPPPPP